MTLIVRTFHGESDTGIIMVRLYVLVNFQILSNYNLVSINSNKVLRFELGDENGTKGRPSSVMSNRQWEQPSCIGHCTEFGPTEAFGGCGVMLLFAPQGYAARHKNNKLVKAEQEYEFKCMNKVTIMRGENNSRQWFHFQYLCY